MRYKLCIFWNSRKGYAPAGRSYSTFRPNLSKNFNFGGPTPLSLHRRGWNLARRRGRAKFHPQILSESVHCVGFRWPKKLNFGQFLIFGDYCTDPLLPMRAKFGVLEQTQGLHLQAKFHLNVFIVSASDGQKPQFWANLDIFGGSYTEPLWPMRANLEWYSRPTVYVYLRNFVSIGLLYRPGEKPQFLPFFGLRHLVVSP